VGERRYTWRSLADGGNPTLDDSTETTPVIALPGVATGAFVFESSSITLRLPNGDSVAASSIAKAQGYVITGGELVPPRTQAGTRRTRQGFNKYGLRGLRSWLRSDKLATLVGAKCSALGDLSQVGTNNIVQATDAQRPTLITPSDGSLPYLLCGQGGVYSSMTFPSNAFSAQTKGQAFIVFQRDEDPASVGNGGLWNLGTSASNALIPFSSDSVVYDTFGASARQDTVTAFEQWPNYGVGATARKCVYSVKSLPGYWECKLNVQTVFTSRTNTVSFGATQGLFVGGAQNTVYFKGKFWEFLMFNRELSLEEESLLVDDLMEEHEIYLGYPRVDNNVINVSGSNLIDDQHMIVTTHDQIEAKRAELIRYFWGPTATGLPSTLPTVTSDVTSPATALTGLARCDRLRLAVAGVKTGPAAITVNLMAYRFVPSAPNGKAVILAHGHDWVVDDSHAASPTNTDGGIWRAIQAYLGAGYDVTLVFMPGYTPEVQGVCETNWGGSGDPHNWLSVTVPYSADGSYLRFFVAMPVAVVNLYASLGITDVRATGYSGGGWTSQMLAVLDARPTKTYPIAGTWPNYMRDYNSPGDQEQVEQGLYARAGCLDLYALAAHNRRQIITVNRNDTVGFGATQYSNTGRGARIRGLTYDQAIADCSSEVAAVVAAAGNGSFAFRIDDDAVMHQMSHQTIAWILADMG
jgi:hypothetical protein